ncbi:hypothetical protein HF086_010901 [Spodoptera exigua]|uniref:Uncharacterized protein n=1 Tax=Spodoptera exigua TaxID=7107 RepID=A0A922SH61_SPOEX|nr:hypothetical protein HF086_010901 [Spodoptera exigua]
MTLGFRMKMKAKSTRHWLAACFVIGLILYFWWLISKITLLESQNKVFKTQLKYSQYNTLVKKISVDSVTTYEVPVIPDAVGTLCETVHIALVLKYSCYNAEGYLSQVQWIRNSHYSGIYALVKLLFPDILPDSISQAIVLDSDLTFLCDVAELWAMFRNMTDDQFIGLVENESNWYYTNKPNRWPALGRGYNTGVMLLDLKKIRTTTDWTRLWRDAVNENIKRLNYTTLADQDVINAIIKNQPHNTLELSSEVQHQNP